MFYSEVFNQLIVRHKSLLLLSLNQFKLFIKGNSQYLKQACGFP